MVTLLGTRMDSHVSLINGYGLTDMIDIPAEGQVGGMVVLWDHTTVNIYNIVRRNQEISTTIEVFPSRNSWLFSSIYASTNKDTRNLLWTNLANISNNYKGPWLIGGDFSNVISENEKFGGRPINKRRSKHLWSTINKLLAHRPWLQRM